VFSGKELAQARQRSAPAAPTREVSTLPLTSRLADPLPAVVVLPPAPPKPKNKGFFGRLKGALSAIF